LAAPAGAQTWQAYAYPEEGFEVLFPAPPRVSTGTYQTPSGMAAPSTTYSVLQDNVLYSVMTADFSETPMERAVVIAEAVKAASEAGAVKMDVEARINAQKGRELSIDAKDGSRSTLAFFYVHDRFYRLEAKALPPDPRTASARTFRFQQSLQFPG
jgi:hypothetical protein